MRLLRGRAQHLTSLFQQDAHPHYRDVVARLQARGRFGVRLGLGRTRALLRRLGDPHLGLPGVLIGGTNGKGSVQALVSAVLREAGYSVGQTPKPHLVSYRERIVVDGELIAAAAFAQLLEEVLAQADRIVARHGAPTEFEVLTAAALTWFRRSGVDVAVVEVGLGGRLDATNVWQGGVSAITNVALDHMEHLGNTVEAIAREKAQIVKRGDVAAVTGAGEPALSVIRRRASRVRVPLRVVEPLHVLGTDRQGLRVAAPDGSALRVGLLGRHQAANAALARAIVDELTAAGIATVTAAQLADGFENARWPGRMELVSPRGRPDIVLDGAHNPAGVAALAVSLADLLPRLTDGPPTVLMGVLTNHWQDGMLDPLADVLPRAALFATRVPNSGDSLDPTRLATAWGAGATPIADTHLAIDAALKRAATSGGPLIVCGSLYLVGYVRARLMAEGAV